MKPIEDDKKELKRRIAELEILISEHEKSEESLRNALRNEFDDREKCIEEQTAGLIAANEQLKQEIFDRKKAEDALFYRMEFERLIGQLSTNFIRLSPDEIDSAINNALKTIGEFVGADRSYVFLFSDKGQKIGDIYEWCAKGIEPQIWDLKGRTIENEFSWFAKKIKKRRVFLVSGCDELPDEAKAEKEYLQAHDVQSLIAVPMFFAKAFIGFVCFDSVRSKKTWAVDIIVLLRIVGEIFANALERKRMDMAIRAKENKYRLLFECASDGIAVLDMDGNILDCNNAYIKLIGRSRKEIIGKNVITFLGKDYKKLMRQRIPIIKKEGSSESELEIIQKDGTMVPIWCKATAIYDEYGNVKGALTHCRDITERKRNEKILEDTCHRMQKIEGKFNNQLKYYGEDQKATQNGFGFIPKSKGKRSIQDFTMFKQVPKKIGIAPMLKNIISRSPKIEHIFDILPSVAASVSTVLIHGESGTGKHLLAQAIHNLSPRKDKPFIVVNCGALPDTLLESELFGYKAGAFTDAKKDKLGRFALADGGTLFLDEIGDISSAMQVRLLRFLQERVYEPLGSVKSIRADVRIITATNKDLMGLVTEGKFREDLFYRINVVKIDLPPLSERLEDVPLLVEEFIRKMNAKQDKKVKGITDEALLCLLSYDYPGNIRELENIIESAFVICNSDYIEQKNLSETVCISSDYDYSKESDQSAFMKMEAAFLMNVLRQNNWNRIKTARQLGIHKATLFRKIKSLGLKLPSHSKKSSS